MPQLKIGFSIFDFLLWAQIFFFKFSSQRLTFSELWFLSAPMFPRRRSLTEVNYTPLNLHDLFFSQGSTAPPVGQGPLVIEASRSHPDTPHSVGLLWTRDRPVTATST